MYFIVCYSKLQYVLVYNNAVYYNVLQFMQVYCGILLYIPDFVNVLHCITSYYTV